MSTDEIISSVQALHLSDDDAIALYYDTDIPSGVRQYLPVLHQMVSNFFPEHHVIALPRVITMCDCSRQELLAMRKMIDEALAGKEDTKHGLN